MMDDKYYTLITGASSGLGREFSIQCAAKGMNIIMIALPNGNTTALAATLELEYGIEVCVFEFDMTDRILLRERINFISSNFKLNFLINNAGIGGTLPITESSFEAADRILEVNIRSMVLITQTLLSNLMAQPQSYILNISSMAAFTPIAYKTVYPASKAFISSFSLGLREELQESNVSVSVLYPGPIMTNSGVTARIVSQGMKGRMGLLPTAEIVRFALKNTLAKKALIIPGLLNRLNHFLMGILPIETKLRIVSRAVKKEIAIK
jgi:short-subunit dehydrogenase